MLTQKATGIDWLMGYVGRESVLSYRIGTAAEMAAGSLPTVGYPIFARPCPVTPRHGFVDSRVVNGPRDLVTLAKEVLAADAQAEIVLMPYLADAPCSAIYCPGMPGKLAIGPSNDGATSGHDSVVLPLNTAAEIVTFWKTPCRGEHPYVEMVTDAEYLTKIVQVRGGPVPVAESTAQTTVTVREVMHATGDLLAWESIMADARHRDGVVVWHPGGNGLSHYAVHARLNEIPITYAAVCPVVGQTLVIGAPPSKLTVADMCAVVTGMDNASKFASYWAHSDADLYNRALVRSTVSAAAMGIQNSPLLLASGESGRLLVGAAVQSLLLIGMALCGGELRHFFSATRDIDRDMVYARMWEDHELAEHQLKMAHMEFSYQQRRNEEHNGFGGKAWATCAHETLRLYNVCKEFRKNPKDRTLRKMVTAANTLLSLAHNNGWWLNKVARSEDLDYVAQGNPLAVARALPAIWAMLGRSLARPVAQTAANVITILIPGTVDSATVQYTLRDGAVHVQAGTQGNYATYNINTQGHSDWIGVCDAYNSNVPVTSLSKSGAATYRKACKVDTAGVWVIGPYTIKLAQTQGY